jgi:hypothetical protein
MAVTVAGIFIICNVGLHITPLTKFFVIFFGGIIGLQCIPAAFLFIGMVKGIFFNTEATLNQTGSLTRSGVKL